MSAAALTALLGSGTGGGQLLNTAVGVGSGIFGSIGANKRQKRAIAAQKEENERARQFNRQMAEWYNEQQRLNIADERAYNTPSAVMARLKDAGLNPDLMYGNGPGSLIDSNVAGTALPDGVAPANVSSPIMNTPTTMESLYQGAAYSKMIAETQNIKADTSKKEGEAQSLNLDNWIKAATKDNEVKLSGITVRLTEAQANYTEAQKSKLISEINEINTHVDLLNSQIRETNAKIANLDSSTLQNRVGAFLNMKRFDIEVQDFQRRLRETDARVNLSNAEAKGILVTMWSKVANLDADTALKQAGLSLSAAEKSKVEAMTNAIDIHSDAAEFKLSQDQTYDSAQRVVSIANQATQSLYHISKIASDWLPAPGNLAKKALRGLSKRK